MKGQTAQQYLGFDDRWLMILGIPAVSLAVTVMIFGTEDLCSTKFSNLPICFVFTTSFWLAFRQLIIVYHRKFTDFEFTKGRLFYILTRSLLIYLAINILLKILVANFYPHNVEAYLEKAPSAKLITISMIMLIFFIYEGLYYLNKSRLMELEKTRLQKISAVQKLDTLKNQVNPHFLFNSLNTLVTMIPEDTEMAITFVQKLSTTYRNILEVRNEKLIPLRQELKALDSYIYLLKVRFQGKIHIYNTLDEHLMDHFILPLSLQILIENAVKHNITAKNKPLNINIYEEEMYVVVENNLQKKNQSYNSTKMGLANIRSRYELLVDKQIIVEETTETFIVKLPLIKNELS